MNGWTPVALEIDPRASVCVVMAAGGYPGKYKKGLEITGIDAANRMRDVVVFHAGTRLEDQRVSVPRWQGARRHGLG